MTDPNTKKGPVWRDAKGCRTYQTNTFFAIHRGGQSRFLFLAFFGASFDLENCSRPLVDRQAFAFSAKGIFSVLYLGKVGLFLLGHFL